MDSIYEIYDNFTKLQIKTSLRDVAKINDNHYLILQFYLKQDNQNEYRNEYRNYLIDLLTNINNKVSIFSKSYKSNITLNLLINNSIELSLEQYTLWVINLLKRNHYNDKENKIQIYEKFIKHYGLRNLILNSTQLAEYKNEMDSDKQEILIKNHKIDGENIERFYHENKNNLDIFKNKWLSDISKKDLNSLIKLIIEENNTKLVKYINELMLPKRKAILNHFFISTVLFSGKIEMLELVRELKYPIKITQKDLLKLCNLHVTNVLCWWLKNTDIETIYDENVFDYISSRGMIIVMDAWKDSKRPILYSSDAFDCIPIHQNDLSIIDWWKQNKDVYPLKATDKFFSNAVKYKKVFLIEWYQNNLIRDINKWKVVPSNDNDILTCPICMDTDCINKNFIKIECNHIYHDECLKIHMSNKSNCPTCRRQIVIPYEFK
jgi:hypothetical protein